MNRFNFYSKMYDRFMKQFGFYKEREIDGELSGINGGSLLDVAGGTGFLISQYRDKFDRIIVVDSSKKMLEYAERRGLEVCSCSALSLPFGDNSFDVIICTDALHHIKEHEAALREMFRVLKSGGVIIIQEMFIRGVKGWLFYFWEKIWIDNSRFITPEALMELANRLGFQGDIQMSDSLEYFYRGTKG